MRRIMLVVCVLLGRAAVADELGDTLEAFHDYSGARVVFERDGLARAKADFFEILAPLPDERRLAAARILLEEAHKYPRGYLGAIHLQTVGVFAAVASKEDDGFHPYDADLGGYRYFGEWNHANAIVCAYYGDVQLPLTFAHEVFHQVDGTRSGATVDDYFTEDDERFARAVDGRERYPAPKLSAADLAALEQRSGGAVLQTAVSDYATKNPNEDQAETARWLTSHLPDALVQVVKWPKLPGSQRILHVLAEHRAALAGDLGPGFDWFVDVALGRAAVADAATGAFLRLRARVGREGAFMLYGAEDPDGVNWTLRADLAAYAADARAVKALEQRDERADASQARAQLRTLALFVRFERWAAATWKITAGTQAGFDEVRTALIRSLPESRAVLRDALERAPAGILGDVVTDEAIAAPNPTSVVVGAVARAGVALNRYLGKIDAEGAPAAIRAVQPATVRLDNGSGVVIDGARGLVLTAGHVCGALGVKRTAELPDGRRFAGVCTAYDDALDLALVTLAGAGELPAARMAPRAPSAGDTVIVIGQPGGSTPNGQATHYQPFHVSVGQIRGFRGDDRIGDQKLGGTMHDAWTYWGHSGSPLFDEQGRIVALHNSWDPKTAMRHAVTWEAIEKFLSDARLR